LYKIFFFLVFTLLLKGGYSQSPFNKIYDFGFHQNNAYALIEHYNHIYTVGQLVSEDSIAQSGIFFAKFDLNGKLIKTNQFIDTLSPYVFFINTNKNIVVLDTHLYIAPNEIDSYVIGCDLSLDSTFLVSKFEDPQLPEITNPLTGIVEFPRNQISVSGITISGPLERRGLLTRVNPLSGETEIDYIEMEGLRISPFKLITKSDNTLLALGYATNGFEIENLDTLYSGIFAIQYDEEFNKINERFYNESLFASGSVFDAVIDSNGDVVLTAIEFIRDTFDFNTNQWLPLNRSSIVKLDSDLNLKWIKPLNDQIFRSNIEKFQSMCESHNQDGYILSGENKTTPGVISEGILMKVDTNGDSVWFRTITTLEERDNDALHDVIKTSDGYYIATGSRGIRLDNDSISSLTQAWLIKFDENGDIVDLKTSTDNTIALDIDVKIFPNPSSDIVYIEQKNISNLAYRLFDNNGQLLVSRANASSYHTFVLDVSGYESGIYFLEIIDQNTGRIFTERLVVK